MKSKIFYWSLYDFANSFVLMSFLFYFSQWLVIDQGKPAWWYNGSLVCSSILFIITAPFLASRVDILKKKIGGLRIWTVLSVIFFAATSLVASLTHGYEILATILYTIANYAYLTCFLYFTPMLNDMSDAGNRSLISGIGESANNIGQVAGILFCLPFLNGITLFGDPGRVQALFPSVVVFALLSIPMLALYRENNFNAQGRLPIEQKKTNTVLMFKEVFKNRPLALMFLAYFLFSDTMLTFANNFPLYLEVVHKVSDNVKSILTAAILLLAAIGAVIFGRIADKKGNIKTIRGVVIVWCFIFVAMASITNFKILVPIFLLAGFLFGPIWSVSRAIIGDLAEKDLEASSYSYYVLVERFASMVGPLVWSIALVVVGENTAGYQAALVLMTVILVISLIALKRVKYNLTHEKI